MATEKETTQQILRRLRTDPRRLAMTGQRAPKIINPDFNVVFSVNGTPKPRPPQPRRRRVRCVTTGEVFESLAAAAKTMDVLASSLSVAINKGRRKGKPGTCRGREWEFVQEEADPR